MLVRAARLLALVLLLAAAPARADDLADFNAAVEAASAHNRVAIEYLRTGNTDLAALEVDHLRQAWGQVGALKRPAVFKDSTLYVTLMTDIATRLVSADMMMNMGKPEIARASLIAIRDNLYELRKSAGVVVLADCVRDAGAEMDALMAFDDRTLVFSTSVAADLAAKAKRYDGTLARCDGIAGPAKSEPEFRRLIDGARQSLTLIPKAIETRDADLVHRVLIELRSFDNLLAFRFG
jgi:hypothetical protein